MNSEDFNSQFSLCRGQLVFARRNLAEMARSAKTLALYDLASKLDTQVDAVNNAIDYLDSGSGLAMAAWVSAVEAGSTNMVKAVLAVTQGDDEHHRS